MLTAERTAVRTLEGEGGRGTVDEAAEAEAEAEDGGGGGGGAAAASTRGANDTSSGKALEAPGSEMQAMRRLRRKQRREVCAAVDWEDCCAA